MPTVLILILLLAVSASAQYHPGDVMATTTDGHLLFVNRAGGVAATQLALGQPLMGVAMQPGNHTVAVADWARRRFLILDLQLRVIDTIATGTLQPLAFTYDGNGDAYFVTAGDRRLYHLDIRSGAVTTVATIPGSGLLARPLVDPETADLLVTDSGGTVGSLQPLYQVSRDGSALTATRRVRRTSDFVKLPTGDLWGGSVQGELLWRLPRTGTLASVVLTQLPGQPVGEFTALAADRASAPQDRLIVGTTKDIGARWNPVGVLWLDLARLAVTRYVDLQGRAQPLSSLAVYMGRNLSFFRLEPRRWGFAVSFPGKQGKAYQVLGSLTGIRPPLVLRDGRRVWLRPDALTALLLHGQLPGLLTGAKGILADLGFGDGYALGFLDLRRLPPAVRGLRLWFVAAVLDPAAPLGIAAISDPVLLPVD